MQFTESEKRTIVSIVREILNSRCISFAPGAHPRAVRLETTGVQDTLAGWIGIYIVKQLLHKCGLVDILKQKHAWREELLGGVFFTIRVLEDILDAVDCDRIRAEFGSAWLTGVDFKKIAQRINVKFLVSAPTDNDEFHMILDNKVIRWHSINHWSTSSFWWEKAVGQYYEDRLMCRKYYSMIDPAHSNLTANESGTTQNSADCRYIN